MPPRVSAVALLALAASAPALAQSAPASAPAATPTYPNVRVTGRLQAQGYWFDNEQVASSAGAQSNFFLRRVRIEARGNITENVSFVIAPSFEGGRTVDVARARGGVRLRDAFADVRLTAAGAPTSFTVRMGQEKRPFGRYELLSSGNLPTIERGAGRGLLSRATNDLFDEAGDLSHDVGASLLVGARHERLQLRVGVYNGQGESQNDRNDAKSFGARATYGVTKKLNVGASFFSHDYIQAPAGGTGAAPDSSARTSAFGLDAAWGQPGEPGLFALVDYLQGQEPSNARPAIRGVNALAAWHVRTGRPGLLWAWEPFARVDRDDPDSDVDDDHETLLDAGVGLYLSSRVHFRAMLERQSFGAAAAIDPIVGVRTQLALSW